MKTGGVLDWDWVEACRQRVENNCDRFELTQSQRAFVWLLFTTWTQEEIAAELGVTRYSIIKRQARLAHRLAIEQRQPGRGLRERIILRMLDCEGIG